MGELHAHHSAVWWRGKRGEWYVVAQVALGALIAIGPREAPGLPRWSSPARSITNPLGFVLVVAGCLFFIAALLRLGKNLTPLPHPKSDSTLTTTGPYAVARHPIYSGALAATLGWSLVVRSWVTVLLVAALFLLLDRKARREERWLEAKFPEYAAYRGRVRRLIPFIY
ncbi:MAG: isoprenylcysteine carboxylmethyltransferase family protein [Candidatus Eisenbacteria bacterium]